MKITKPKNNQILIEDNALKGFDTKVVSKTGLAKSEFNKEYEVLFLAYRQAGMDASKQIMMGNKMSIMTLMSSMMEQLVRNKVLNIVELKYMVDMVEKSINGNLED